MVNARVMHGWRKLACLKKLAELQRTGCADGQPQDSASPMNELEEILDSGDIDKATAFLLKLMSSRREKEE